MEGISIVIVSWNARDYLRECLNSIRNSGGVRVREVFVIDNASSDGSPEMVQDEFPEVTLIRSGENLGFARANNIGIKRASGEFICLINSDVVVHTGCLSKLAELLNLNPQAGIVGPKIIGADGRVQCTCRRLPSIWNMICRILALDTAFSGHSLFSGCEIRTWPHDSATEVEVLSGCFVLARRAAVEKVGGLDERFFFYAEDVDWCKRFLDAGWRVCFFPQATALHYGGGSSSNAPLRYSIEMLRANMAFWRKHHGLLGQAVYYLLCLLHHGLRFVPRGVLRITGLANAREIRGKFEEDFYCLRWLLTGKGA